MQAALEPIDLSTTYYRVLPITKAGSLHKFAESVLKQQPQDNNYFGYIKATGKKLEKARKKKRIILMEEVSEL